MKLAATLASWRPQRSMRRAVPWLGAIFIAAIVAMAVFDMVRTHREAVAQTGRELVTQARIIAEQTARSVQAVDVVLRHIEEQHRQGRLDGMDSTELRDYLREQAIGLVQINGLILFDADGTPRANSFMPLPPPGVNVASHPLFPVLRDDGNARLLVAGTTRGIDGEWVFPVVRRLTSATGAFAGGVAARGRVDYFQTFFRDIQLDPGTKTTLMHRNGTLLARHPPAESALGQRFPLLDDLLAANGAGRGEPLHRVSPIDGVDRYAAVQVVPDYPLAVVVTRDADIALAPWRQQALGSAARTLALAALAAVMMAFAMRQFSRLDASSRSLEAAKERFALAVQGSDDGIWDWDHVGGTMFASARAREILGMVPGPETEEATAWFQQVHVHPDDEARRWQALDEHMAGHTAAYEQEFRVRQPDGHYRWVRVRGVAVRNGSSRPVRMAGSVSDVDARRGAEEAHMRIERALRQSEERYQLAVAGSNEGLWDWDLKHDMLFLSQRAQTLMGLDPGEPLRARRDWIALTHYHPEDRAQVRRAIGAHLRGVTPTFEIEYRLWHPSGEWHWYRQRGIAVRDDGGKPHRMAGSMEDISRRRHAEAERERLEVQLRQAQKLEAIGTLAGGIAHDFNNILAAILGYGEMAQKGAAEGTALRRHIDAAQAAGLRAKSLVERILAFSRSGVGERVPVHVQSVVGEALDLVQASLPQGVTLERSLEAGDAALLGDPTQIHQVVMNLCANAVQAMKSSGTMVVRVGTEVLQAPRTVSTSCLPAGDYLRLVVRDTGMGIAPQVLERIFDPFFTTKEVGVGTGLGLSLVHGIVTDLGGGIEVESRMGEGSAFTVWLPWQRSLVAATSVEEPLQLGDGETVLIVDDEEALVRLGEEMMAELGYEPVGFASSAAALASFRSTPQRFSAVLSDESMPEMTGSELAREIRSIRADIPIVLMSGYVTPALSVRAREAGVREVLSKPIVMRDIARSLASALRR
ncbi:MAG TPA: PAS domain-containing protein [Albitalea sp.]|uniref:PAS domain-containing protein n=1 Tax=Piscinibacter sp. TaxID=1903157 RepID=UPI002ED5A33C